jgi:hypothetical protein
VTLRAPAFRYRPRPTVEVEARPWNGDPADGADIVAWARDTGGNGELVDHFLTGPALLLWTPAGSAKVRPGDYVVRVPETGDWFVQTPGGFALMYEAVMVCGDDPWGMAGCTHPAGHDGDHHVEPS